MPNAKGQANPSTTYRNGQACPSGSKYAGQAGTITYAYWTSFGQTKPTITTNPSSVKFSQYLRVTMSFNPKGVVPPPPSQATVNAMVLAAQNTGSTTTTTSAG